MKKASEKSEAFCLYNHSYKCQKYQSNLKFLIVCIGKIIYLKVNNV